LQPSPPLRCEMAVRAAALAQARTAELLGVPAPASHQSTSCSGRCKKQTGPALFAPGNSRAASAIPPAAWLTHRVPARPPPASVLHLPSLPLGAGLVCAKRRRGFPSEHQRIFSKGQRFLRAHLPLAPSLFVFLLKCCCFSLHSFHMEQIRLLLIVVPGSVVLENGIQLLPRCYFLRAQHIT